MWETIVREAMQHVRAIAALSFQVLWEIIVLVTRLPLELVRVLMVLVKEISPSFVKLGGEIVTEVLNLVRVIVVALTRVGAVAGTVLMLVAKEIYSGSTELARELIKVLVRLAMGLLAALTKLAAESTQVLVTLAMEIMAPVMRLGAEVASVVVKMAKSVISALIKLLSTTAGIQDRLWLLGKETLSTVMDLALCIRAISVTIFKAVMHIVAAVLRVAWKGTGVACAMVGNAMIKLEPIVVAVKEGVVQVIAYALFLMILICRFIAALYEIIKRSLVGVEPPLAPTEGGGAAIVEQICRICGDTASVSCGAARSDPNQHHFCRDCFQRFCHTSFQAGGVFETSRLQSTDGSQTVSEVGELPCPFFPHECSRHALPSAKLWSVMDDTLWSSYNQAVGRMAVHRNEEEQQAASELQQQSRYNQKNSMDLVLRAVQEALSLGGRMKCPVCRHHGDKDDGCMHIQCGHCGHRWCYCCGRSRENLTTRCRCDARSANLERNAGWANMNRMDESDGYGALHEFHRRRMIYFVQKVKAAVPLELWESFRATHGDCLMETPTIGRCILWNEIDSGVPDMLFGETNHVNQLAWHNDASEIVTNLRDRIEDVAAPLFAQHRVSCHVATPPPAGGRGDRRLPLTQTVDSGLANHSEQAQPIATRQRSPVITGDNSSRLPQIEITTSTPSASNNRQHPSTSPTIHLGDRKRAPEQVPVPAQAPAIPTENERTAGIGIVGDETASESRRGMDDPPPHLQLRGVAAASLPSPGDTEAELSDRLGPIRLRFGPATAAVATEAKQTDAASLQRTETLRDKERKPPAEDRQAYISLKSSKIRGKENDRTVTNSKTAANAVLPVPQRRVVDKPPASHLTVIAGDNKKKARNTDKAKCIPFQRDGSRQPESCSIFGVEPPSRLQTGVTGKVEDRKAGCGLAEEGEKKETQDDSGKRKENTAPVRRFGPKVVSSLFAEFPLPPGLPGEIDLDLDQDDAMSDLCDYFPVNRHNPIAPGDSVTARDNHDDWFPHAPPTDLAADRKMTPEERSAKKEESTRIDRNRVEPLRQRGHHVASPPKVARESKPKQGWLKSHQAVPLAPTKATLYDIAQAPAPVQREDGKEGEKEGSATAPRRNKFWFKREHRQRSRKDLKMEGNSTSQPQQCNGEADVDNAKLSSLQRKLRETRSSGK